MPPARRAATGTAPPPNPHRREEIEDWLDQKGVTWEFVADYDISRIDMDKSINNQARVDSLINQQIVDQYAEAMLNGDVFPAVVLSRTQSRNKSAAVDGNHRLSAYIKNSAQTIPVYLITAGKPRMIVQLTFEANVKHGMPTSHNERLWHAAWLMENGASEREASQAVNIKASDLRKFWNNRKADIRAKEVGLLRSEWEGISASARHRLANISTDEGFKAAAGLVYRANLGAGEVFDLVQRLNAVKSSSKQEALVKAFQRELGDRIQDAGAGIGTGGRRARTPKQNFNMALSTLTVLPENLEVIAEKFIGDERPEAAKRARDAASRLSSIADLLEAAPA